MIRPAKLDDMAHLKELIEAHAIHEGAPFNNGFQNTESLTKLVFGDAPRIFLWVAEMDAGLVGYMSATIDYSTWNAAPFVYLDCLYLTHDARGQGFGLKFIKTLDAFAAARGISEIQWQTPPDNDIGLGFYRHIGAAELPKRRFLRTVPPEVANPKPFV